jgi:transcription antitermination factor NusG
VGNWDSKGGSLSKSSLTSLVAQYFGAPDGAEIKVQPGKGSHPWFALRVRSRYENIVATILGGKGYEWFLPLYKSRRPWSDRIKEIQLPLFPGYVFCRFNVQHRLPILTTPGVVSVVGIGRRPVPIDEAEIAAIQAAVRSELPSRPWPFLEIGQRVRVEYGPLCGLEGILLDFKGHHRLVLSVILLQRSVAVDVDSAWVIPIPQQRQACAATPGSAHVSSQLTA